MSSISTLNQGTGQLRIKMQGLNFAHRLKLPQLELVLRDAAKAVEMMQSSVAPSTEGREPTWLVYARKLPALFKFSLFCEVYDVPSNILPQCVWTLEWIILGLLEASDLQFRNIWDISTNESAGAQYVFISNARWKAAQHLLKPEIDRPSESLRHLNDSIEAYKVAFGNGFNVWAKNPTMFVQYCIALARSRTDDPKAKNELTRIINDKDIDKGSDGVAFLTMAKIYLSRVLRRLGENAEAQKHEKWLVDWLRKNPHRIRDQALIEIFTTDTDNRDPVLTGLGGETWLNNRRHSIKNVLRSTRVCRQCDAREPLVKLFKCGRCKHIFYCSKKCQLANYPYHKASCKEEAEFLSRIHDMTPDKARLAEDWRKWRLTPVPAHSAFLAHVLGLRRDPSRCRTHIIFEQVEYVPRSKTQLERFKVVSAGVFKLDDVWTILEGLMGLNKGEGKEYVKEMLDEFDHSAGDKKDMMHVLELMFGSKPDVEAYFRTYPIHKKMLYDIAYDPNWRISLNHGDPVVKAMHFPGVKDAEKIF